jgi:hypothetical protein
MVRNFQVVFNLGNAEKGICIIGHHEFDFLTIFLHLLQTVTRDSKEQLSKQRKEKTELKESFSIFKSTRGFFKETPDVITCQHFLKKRELMFPKKSFCEPFF